MNEMHIIEAVSKRQFPTMTNVAKTLKGNCRNINY